MKLYEISNQIRDLPFVQEPDTPFYSINIEQTELAINELKLQFDEKVLNIAKLTKELDADIDAIDNEVKRLTDRKKSLQGKKDWFKSYILQNMIDSGIDKVKDAVITVAIKVNPPSVEVEDVMKLPESYRKQIWQPEKAMILEAFKSTGEIIDGAKIITDKKRVDIK